MALLVKIGWCAGVYRGNRPIFLKNHSGRDRAPGHLVVRYMNELSIYPTVPGERRSRFGRGMISIQNALNFPIEFRWVAIGGDSVDHAMSSID